MSHNHNNNDFSNLLFKYPSNSEEDQVPSNVIDDKFIWYKPSKSSEINIDEEEEIYFHSQHGKKPREKKPKIFNIEKTEKKYDLETIKSIKINKLFPPCTQIFDMENKETEENSNINKEKKEPSTKNFIEIKKKRTPKNKKNEERKDNCRLKIGRNFFNSFLIKSINNSLIQDNRPHLYFEKFPQNFIKNAVEKKNKDYLGKTLEKILTNKELYVKYPNNLKQFSLLPSVQMKEDKEELGKFWHNFNTLKKLKSNDNNDNILKKSILNKYLGMNYKDLYREYFNSEVHKEKLMKLKGQKAEEFEKFSDFDNFIGFFEN